MDEMDIVEKELKKIDDSDEENGQTHPEIVMEVCPVCGEPDLTYYRMTAGGIILGLSAEQKYQCKDCGYIGSVSIQLKSREDIQKIKENYQYYIESQKQHIKSKQIKDQKPYLLNPEYIWFFRGILLLTILVHVFIMLSLIFSGI